MPLSHRHAAEDVVKLDHAEPFGLVHTLTGENCCGERCRSDHGAASTGCEGALGDDVFLDSEVHGEFVSAADVGGASLGGWCLHFKTVSWFCGVVSDGA